ncbi:MAG: CDP-archaeol synthase [Candidatus Hodarchaeota archaeon]
MNPNSFSFKPQFPILNSQGNGKRTSTIPEGDDGSNFKKNVKISRILLLICTIVVVIFIISFSMVYSISDFLVILGLSMLFIGPTYIANAMMVFTSDGRPIDGGRNFIDGKRLFGRTKTIGGFIGGLIFGFLFGLLFGYLFYWNFPAIQKFAETQLNLLKFVDLLYLEKFLHPPVYLIPIRAFFCGLGSPLGDLTGSFLKRRFSIGSGKPFWLVDQLDFVVITIILSFAWFPFNVYNIILLLIITPSIALYANTVAYGVGKKKEPW